METPNNHGFCWDLYNGWSSSPAYPQAYGGSYLLVVNDGETNG